MDNLDFDATRFLSAHTTDNFIMVAQKLKQICEQVDIMKLHARMQSRQIHDLLESVHDLLESLVVAQEKISRIMQNGQT